MVECFLQSGSLMRVVTAFLLRVRYVITVLIYYALHS